MIRSIPALSVWVEVDVALVGLDGRTDRRDHLFDLFEHVSSERA